VIEELSQVLRGVIHDFLPNLAAQIGYLGMEVIARAGRLVVVAVASDVVGDFVHEVRASVGINEAAATFPSGQIADRIEQGLGWLNAV